MYINKNLLDLKNKIFNSHIGKYIPKLIYHTILIFGIILNIIYVIGPPNFLYPDEIYQTLEVAHKLVYGTGILSWEWHIGGSPIYGKSYGPIRSLITPLILAIFFVLGNFLHLNYWNVILPSIRVILIINFMIGLYFASKIIKELSPDKFSYVNKIFLIIALFYHDTFLYGSKTLSNSIVISFVFIALYLWIKSTKSKADTTLSSTHNSIFGKFLEFFGGICVGFAIWIRPDTIIVMGVFVLLYLNKIQLNRTINFALGFIISAVFDGILDFLYYGKFFETFFNFLSFNLSKQFIFGTEPNGWYFSTFIRRQGSFSYLFNLTCFVLLTIAIFLLIIHIKPKFYSLALREFIVEFKLFLWVFIVLALWETQPHKEKRFLVLWEISFLMMGAYAIYLSTKYVKIFLDQQVLYTHYNKILSKLKLNNQKYSLFILILLISIISAPYFVADAQEASQISWNNNADILEATAWVGQQKNLIGVGIIVPIYHSGGYSYLNRNVTIYHFGNPFDVNSINTGVYGNNGIKYPVNTKFVPAILANQHLINYLIVPRYTYKWGKGKLQSLIILTGYKLVLTIDGSCDIYTI